MWFMIILNVCLYLLQHSKMYVLFYMYRIAISNYSSIYTEKNALKSKKITILNKYLFIFSENKRMAYSFAFPT